MDEMRSKITLSDVIGKRIKVTRAGREYKACCPFHKEKTASFTINDEKNFYHCFGCGAHGDAIGFIMNYQNMNFMESVEYLAGVAGIEVPKQEFALSREEAKKQKSLYDLVNIVSEYYSWALFDPKNKRMLQYLVDRGFSLGNIKEFGIGYSPSNDEGVLSDKLLAAGFTKDDMVAAGVFRKDKKKQGEVYQFFRHRIIYPVKNLQGKVVAFGGRILPEAYGGYGNSNAPKYINSSETPIFHKGTLLYGLSKARRFIGDSERVIVVEGYMDVMALVQAGFNGAVAPLGTALTETQVLALWKVMPKENRVPILCFDGDNAGQRAASRALDRVLPILKPDCSINFAFLPKDHDPDSLINAEGVSAMDRVLKNSVSLFDVMWQEEERERDLSQPEARAGLKYALINRAKKIADKAVQETYINLIEERFAELYLSKKSTGFIGKAKGKWNKNFKPYNRTPDVNDPYRPSSVMVNGVKSPKKRHNEHVRILLALMINHPSLYEEFGEGFGSARILDSDYDKLRQEIIILFEGKKDLDYQYVRGHLSALGYKDILEKIFDSSLYLHASFAKPDELYEVVETAWRDIWEIGFLNQ